MRPDPIAALAEEWGEMFKQSQIQGGYRKMRRASGVADSVHDNLAQIAAAKRRVRRAAKRAEDERRTAEGRSRELNQPWRRGPMGMWDWPSIGQHLPDPQWRIRSRERRALPGMERPWFMSRKQSDAAWRSNGSQRVRWFMAVAGIDGRHVRNEHSRGAL